LETLVLKSPAKINLFLEVLRKREDGYHQILSLMQAVDLCDELILEKRKSGVVIGSDHPDCPTDESNLAFKAAKLILEEAKLKEGVSIQIKKKIPVAAGLGGGSSNAATTLKGINRLFELNLSDQKLHLLASRIGSDVPFFIYSGQALVRGRGEEIEPITMYRDYWLILVCPNFKVSTEWAYQKLKISLTRRKKEIIIKNLENRDQFFEALPNFKNDLEEVVSERYSVVQKIEDTLNSSGAVKSSMSGSGPTVYGVFEQKPKAEEVAKSLSRTAWDWSFGSTGQFFLAQPIPGSI
jgi:4-diphosphocytidyl-2-C-methyl-D-erythritol kinase